MPGNFTFFTQNIFDLQAEFDEAESKHMIQVLRYQLNDDIYFTDGLGNKYQGRISEISKKGVKCAVLFKKSENQPQLTLGVGIIKNSDRIETLVEKCTELGLKSLYFIQTEKSIRSNLNIDKLKKTAISALKQSNGSWLPQISIIRFKEALSLNFEKKLIAHCQDQDEDLREKIAPNALVLIGPEGDFSPTEIRLALDSDFKVIQLGHRILRTETAAIAVCTLANIAV
jgi:16S rRNA (uracil1498-N3)-methyltransferase